MWVMISLITFWNHVNKNAFFRVSCSSPISNHCLCFVWSILFNAQFSGTVTQSRMLRWQQGLRGKGSYRRRQLEQLASPTLPNRNFKNKKTWKNLEKRDVMLFVKSLEEVANHFLPEQSSLLRSSTFFG